MTDLGKEQTRDFIAASEHWFGIKGTRTRALIWYALLCQRGLFQLPFVLVHDLGYLLLTGHAARFRSGSALSSWASAERSARLFYEDHTLSPWAMDRSLQQAHILIAGLPQSLADEAVAHAIALALAKDLAHLPLMAVNPAHLRDLEVGDSCTEIMRHAVWRQVQEAVSALTSGPLLEGEELWELAHLAVLKNDGDRLALREIHRISRFIGRLPHRTLIDIGRRQQEIISEKSDEDIYPIGGFSAVASKGTFENLVRSEVAYAGEHITGDIDLFDVRYCENELLFYTRDDAPVLDDHRAVVFTIERPMQLRHKERALPAQMLVMIDALILILLRDLQQAFGVRRASIHLDYLTKSEAGKRVAEEERNLLGLALAADIAYGRATLHRGSAPAQNRHVVFSPLALLSSFDGCAYVQASGESWLLTTGNKGQHLTTPYDVRTTEGLRALADALLLALV